MIRSMTAFAAREAGSPLGTLACEMRSVNHRFLELSLRLPEELRAFEPSIRDAVAARLTRGKVELSIRTRGAAVAPELALDEAMIARLGAAARIVAREFPALGVDLVRVLEYPGVLRRADVDAAALGEAVAGLVDATLGDFVAARAREGAKLAAAMGERLDRIERVVAQVRGWLPEIRTAARTRLESRLADLGQPLEPGRLEQELVLQLSKLDVDEELDRLAAHVAEARRVLARPEPAGRRLDFLLQEFNREANTLGSKSVDQRTTNAAVELKVLIEQVREQVQNLE
jgi:uncharacterized protein (TIGR00255 family)